MVQLTFQSDSFKRTRTSLLTTGKLISCTAPENGIDAGGAGVELKNIGVEKVMLLKHGLISWAEESLSH